MITQLIEFDVKKNSHVKITAKEGDINSRNLEFRLLDNSLPFSLAGRTVRCYMVKPDKRIVFSELQIIDAEDGRCVLTLSLQSLIVSGMAKLELIIYEAGKKLSIIPIKMDIIKSLNSDKLLESTNEFGALNDALWKIDTFKASIDSKASKEDLKKLSSQLDTKMNLEAGKKAYIISGVIRNSGDGWELIDDEGHNSINITSVIQDEDNKTIAVVYPSAIKVGNFNVSPDETLAQMNVRCGASVSLNKASIKCFTDFTGYFNGSGLIVSQKGTWFDGTYTFTPLADGTGFNLIYDGDGSTIRPSVQLTSYADTGMNTQEMRVKANSSTSIDFRAYGDLEGKLICDGATFTLETPCVANISFSYRNGVLDITHISGSTETEFNRFNNVQLTPFINDLNGEIVQPRVFGCTRNKIRIIFYDKTGTQITSATPLKNMSLMFTRPNLKVPQKIDKLGIWYFNCGSTILRPSKFISAGGNLWLTGTQQI